MTDQVEKARRFLDLHHGQRPLLLPNPWDRGSAVLLASLGFQALALCVDLDRDRDGRAAGMDDVRVEAQQVAYEYWLLEGEGVHRHGRDASARATRGRNGSGNIHLGHDPAAEHVTMDICIRWHWHDAQDRVLVRGGQGDGSGI